MDSLFKQDYNSAESIVESIKGIVTLESEAVESSLNGSQDGATSRLIIESIRRTAEYAM